MPKLSPIIAGLLVEAFAERAQPQGDGGRALALDVASILRGKKTQRSDFGRWRRAASAAAPTAATGVPSSSPADLRQWLTLRWESAYRAWFGGRQRYWSTFMVDIAHNPLAVFEALADVSVVSQLYEVAWWRQRS